MKIAEMNLEQCIEKFAGIKKELVDLIERFWELNDKDSDEFCENSVCDSLEQLSILAKEVGIGAVEDGKTFNAHREG